MPPNKRMATFLFDQPVDSPLDEAKALIAALGDREVEGRPLTESSLERKYYEENLKQHRPSIDATLLEVTPELTPGGYQGPGFDNFRDIYIKKDPRSGIALLPGGVQGPAEGPNIPIKNYGGVYMPDATQPTGYRPGPRA